MQRDLRRYPFDASALNREIEQMPMKVAKLSGYLYQNIQVDENGAGKVILSQELLSQYGIDDSETANSLFPCLVSLMRY